MLMALILVCSIALVPDIRECTKENAVDIIYGPEPTALPSACLIMATELAASLSFGSEGDTYVKIGCARKRV
jgi:hypothetical protein